MKGIGKLSKSEKRAALAAILAIRKAAMNNYTNVGAVVTEITKNAERILQDKD